MNNSMHGDCKVFNPKGILTRVERIEDRVEVNIMQSTKLIGIRICVGCEMEFEKYFGNQSRCEECSKEQALKIQREWKAKRREAIRTGCYQSTPRRYKRKVQLQGY